MQLTSLFYGIKLSLRVLFYTPGEHQDTAGPTGFKAKGRNTDRRQNLLFVRTSSTSHLFGMFENELINAVGFFTINFRKGTLKKKKKEKNEEQLQVLIKTFRLMVFITEIYETTGAAGVQTFPLLYFKKKNMCDLSRYLLSRYLLRLCSSNRRTAHQMTFSNVSHK